MIMSGKYLLESWSDYHVPSADSATNRISQAIPLDAQLHTLSYNLKDIFDRRNALEGTGKGGRHGQVYIQARQFLAHFFQSC